MKTKHLVAVTLLAVTVGAGALQAQTNVETFNFTNGLAVPDASLSGLADVRTISVTEPTWEIVDVNVSLFLSGGFNGDLYAFLTHDSGFSVLLNRSGRTAGNLFGYGDAGYQITLDDAATANLHGYGGNGGLLLTGLWQPDGRNVHPLTVLDTVTPTAFLSSFNGGSGSGTWTLFLADVAGGQQSVIETWSVEITTVAVPEPGTAGLIAFGLIATAMSRRRQAPRN
jgi:subtilisin-like proprotein convertase family protein